MPGSLHNWYSLSWLDMLAERQSVLSGRIELKRLARLRDMLHAHDGSVTAKLRFGKRDGAWVIVNLECEATLALLCQRCLEPMLHTVAARVELGLVESASMASRLPEDYEPVVLEGDRLMPARLIEDELIVSLPLMPKHAHTSECGSLVRRRDESTGEAWTLDCAPPTSH